MNKKQNKVKENPKGLWTLNDISEETKKLVKGYAQDRREKLGVCVDRLLKEAISYNTRLMIVRENSSGAVTMSNSASLISSTPLPLIDEEKRTLDEPILDEPIIEEHFKKEWIKISKKPWWRFWG